MEWSFGFAAVVCSLLVTPRSGFKRDQFWSLVVGIAVALALGEVACRTLDIGATVEKPVWELRSPSDRTSGVPYEPGSNLVFQYPDNPRGYFDSRNRVVGRVNSRGFRGEECRLAAPEDTVRIAVLGDSFTLGIGVRDEDTLPVQLEADLADLGVSTEALNFGLGGSSTVHQVIFLEKYVLQFDPDVVLLVVFLNDAGLPDTIPILTRTRFLPALRSRSFLLNAVATVIESRISHRTLLRAYGSAFDEANPGWQQMMACIRRAEELSRERGFRLVVAVYPVLIRLDERYPFRHVHDQIGRSCRQEGIMVIDLLEAFEGQLDRDMWVHRMDQHPNEVAQALAADMIASRLVESGVVGHGTRRSGPSSD